MISEGVLSWRGSAVYIVVAFDDPFRGFQSLSLVATATQSEASEPASDDVVSLKVIVGSKLHFLKIIHVFCLFF